jgi:hypothetical protein
MNRLLLTTCLGALTAFAQGAKPAAAPAPAKVEPPKPTAALTVKDQEIGRAHV